MRRKIVATLIASLFISANSSIAAPQNDTPPPPDPPEDSRENIKGKRTRPAPVGKVMDALDALDDACPGLKQEIEDADIGIVDLKGEPSSPTAGRLERVSNDDWGPSFALLGAHDNDTIAADFDKICGAVLASTLAHEFGHLVSAREHETAMDPTDGSQPEGSSPEEKFVDEIRGGVNHVGLYVDDWGKQCQVVASAGDTPGGSITPADCKAAREGLEQFKEDVAMELEATRENIQADADAGLIDTLDNDDPQAELDELENELGMICHNLDGMRDCPEEPDGGGDDDTGSTGGTGGDGGE